MARTSKPGVGSLGAPDSSALGRTDAGDLNIRPPSPRERRATPSEEMIDQTIAHSFPASDPPSWTLGI